METHENLCMNCFSELTGKDRTCSVCGWNNAKQQVIEGLPYQTVVGNHYIIGRAKSMNGEGIVYSAYDISKKRMVSIHEFYPFSIAKRNAEDHTIVPLEKQEGIFDDILNEFIESSKNTARLKEATVINTVIDIFEEYYTAYAVYAYVPSISLRRYVQKNGALSWNTVYSLFLPVMTALGLMNSLGIPHLGISPDTIRITTEGNALITGFCIAKGRQVGTEIIDELFDGCSAIEQYMETGVCSEMTDVYAFAATMMFAFTGTLPAPAPQRLKDPRLMISKEYLRDIPPYVVSALANALQVKQEERTASFERLRTELVATPTVVSEVSNTGAIRRLPPIDGGTIHNKGLPPVVWLIGACAVTLVALFIVVNTWLNGSGMAFSDLNSFFSSKQELITDVPNMIGESFTTWALKIDSGNYDFVLNVTDYEFSDTVEEGSIISQEPKQGEALPSSKIVNLIVSRGSAMRSLPPIQGMTFEEANKILTDNGFSVTRQDQPDTGIAAGSVVGYQDYTENDSLAYGTSIVIIVSTGVADEDTPADDGMDAGGDDIVE